MRSVLGVDAEDSAATTGFESAVILSFEDYAFPSAEAPAGTRRISDVLRAWESDPDKRSALEAGRRWVADTFYESEGDSLRTLRLRKGWSQARLAAALHTSQSHVARIENGADNLQIATCRKLCDIFEIDMNRLDAILRRRASPGCQEAE